MSRKSKQIEDDSFSTVQLLLLWSREFGLSSICRCAVGCVGHIGQLDFSNCWQT